MEFCNLELELSGCQLPNSAHYMLQLYLLQVLLGTQIKQNKLHSYLKT